MAADRSAVITALDNALTREEVDKYLRQHWARLVPNLVAATTDQPVRLKHDEAVLRAVLLEPIEAFIVGREHSEKADKFQHLKKDDVPSYLCNKNFRAGDPTYSCRECAVDSTCVLCMECFKQSPHQNHRYRISSSGGGGYCDCGDPEAWKQDFACRAHQPPSGHAEDIDVGDARKRLPVDVAKRFSVVVQSALCYAYQMLTLRDGSQSPTDILSGRTPSSSPPKHRSFLTSTSSLLGLGGSKDGEEDQLKYATILYNDEVHTYDGVITVLSRTLECTAEEALEYATVVDHEGRCPVKFGTLAECERVKTFVEKNSRRPQPLRLDVILTSVYSHQVFAQLVLKWIQELAEACEGFKAIVCDVSLQDSWDIDAVNIVSAFLLVDVRLWKAARNAVHSLFMATFLSFNDAKIAFSRLLAQLYPDLMAAFVADDHEHTDSCTSLGVQLFTVPTVARTLFADGLVEVIVRSFVNMCRQRRNDQGRLSFERSTQPLVALQFKRALYTLYDTRYLLNTVPKGDQWNDALRKGFIGTFEQFLQVMEMMEGMDSHVRRTQSHVEYEADWEPAFNVQLRMQSILDLLQQWCASDAKVLEVCLKRLMDSAIKALGTVEKFEKREVAGRHITQCIEYDVATQVVSIHHPVIRMLASLLVSGLQQGILLDGQPLEYRLTKQAKELMELPLRTLVLVSQANAGMWRRNGYALANQIYFYQQPRCREEMLDKDVVMMQACAAVMKPDDCMIAILDKFGLIAWADEVFDATPPKTEEDSIRQVMFLAEEFLYCLIVLVGERYYPGVGRVTAEDCLKNELIHQLCIQSMSYSELLKNLPDQEAKSGEVDDILKEVAVFKRTSPTSKGSFELKAEYMSHYNMFFYHYTRIEHSKAEDTQRKRKKKNNEEIVFPPPSPPPFSGVFQHLVRLLDCDVMIHLLNLTVRRALNNHPRSFSEGQLIRALYLIGYGLHEEKRMRQPQPITNPSVKPQFIEKAADAGIFSVLRELKTQKDGEAYKSLVEWVLAYYEELTNVKEATTTPRTSESMDVVVGSMEKSSALMMGTSPADNEEDAEEKKKRAVARRERIMAQMKSAQKSFVSHNLQEMSSLEQPASVVENPDISIAETVTPTIVEEKAKIVAVGSHRSLHNIEEDLDEKHTCILCSESHAVNLGLEAFVAVAYVQRSTVLSQEDRQGVAERFVREPATSVKELSQALIGNPLWMGKDLSCAPHVSSCGHLLHAKCWKTYFESVVARERRRTIRLRSNNGSFDVTKNEFRCPLCSRLCNAAIPFFPLTNPKANVHSMDTTEDSTVNLDTFIESLKVLFKPNEEAVRSGEAVPKMPKMETDEKGGWNELSPMMVVQNDDQEERYRDLRKLVRSNIRAGEHARLLANVQQDSAQNERLRGIDVKNEEVVTEGFVEAIRTFQTQVYQMIMNTSSEMEETLSCAVGWSSCSYSIQCIEQCLRNEKKSLLGSLSSRQYLCLKSLIRATCWTSAAYEPKVLTENAVCLFATLFRPAAPLPFHLDAFSLLVNLTCAFPWLPWTEEGFTGQSAGVLICRPPVGDNYDSFILTLVYALHAAQVLLGLEEENQDGGYHTEESLPAGDIALVDLYRRATAWKRPRLANEGPVKVPKKLLQLVREGTWPFLRSSALFYHFVTGIAAPASLKKDNPSCDSEYEDLMTYLNLPLSFSHLLDQNPALKQLMTASFATPFRISTMPGNTEHGPSIIRKYPRPRPSFAKLPQDFVDVINRASQKTCKTESDERRSPALCLVCGQLLCSQSMCCQFKMDNGQSIGGCTYHSLTCGGGTGLFLRVRENQVLMLHGSNKGCFGASPYVDAYGEPDPYLRRGNPLHLSQERLDQLYRHYMHHDIADEVSHAMDQNGTLAGFDWYHF